MSKKSSVILLLSLAAALALASYLSWRSQCLPASSPAPASDTSSAPEQTSAPESPAAGEVYINNQYGFQFVLPESWKGYTVVQSEWEGYHQGESGQLPAARGPLLSLRHPLWTAAEPRQDIPIMVFTLSQWNEIENEILHIGAAPIGPSELGRNDRYVFALPARYNFAFPAGYEEVEQILAGNPLHPLGL